MATSNYSYHDSGLSKKTTKLIFVDFPKKLSSKEYTYVNNLVESCKGQVEDAVWLVGRKIGNTNYRIFVSLSPTVSDEDVKFLENHLLMTRDMLFYSSL